MQLPQRLQLEEVTAEDMNDRFSHSAWEASGRYRMLDPDTGRVWGFIVVDQSLRGPGLGGIRIAPDLTLGEVMRLAHVMTLKNSAANLPLGGGKSGIIADAEILRSEPAMKKELIAKFAEAAFEVSDYIPAPDMGTDEQDIQLIYDLYSTKLGARNHRRGGAGRPPELGGVPIDDWGLTAHGLFAAAETLESLDEDLKLEHCDVVVQGYGNVGSRIAEKLAARGARIVGASDIHAALWNAQGLDLDALRTARRNPWGLDTYSGKVDKKWGPDRLHWLLEAPCHFLIPAARPNAITARNADRIQCRYVLQGANVPSSKVTEYYLQKKRGIVSLCDFIVNAGGVIGCAAELEYTSDAAYRERVDARGFRNYLEDRIYETVRNNTRSIMAMTLENEDLIFRDAAEILAHERLNVKEKEIWI
ncbi:MAG: Glu/Leu/Phe/Val dehydrogenase [Candidatus Nitrohelix vancouverensis]|uniref:Glutamate dehydrogenase n=1 Tax=Candidatus Nitrohelix vancouverensis TaxID=2705534 RepID=A0A7T0C3L0_9BACT|nr:MAG: Glu/Leu/Phe/Val dehydrogenase [Candidatus Nitrohelix vancouverensis]